MIDLFGPEFARRPPPPPKLRKVFDSLPLGSDCRIPEGSDTRGECVEQGGPAEGVLSSEGLRKERPRSMFGAFALDSGEGLEEQLGSELHLAWAVESVVGSRGDAEGLQPGAIEG